jgi:putative colanic acid biosynthesis acetyltransferase WcaF
MTSGHRARLDVKFQASAYASPWTLRTRIGVAAFSLAWTLLARWTPKPLSPWRVLLLRLFGARVEGTPFVASSAIVKMPWQLVLEDRACLAPGCEVYNLGPCIVRARATVAQYVYLCGGTHDLSREELPLATGAIDVGADAFIGAKAIVLPGVRIGEGAVIGAGSVVTKDVDPWTTAAGNPAKPIGPREHPRAPR